jgi:hypothetical protein
MSPTFMPKAASSKGLTMAPRAKKSRSPPLAAEPGSSEFFLATSAKLSGCALTSASRASALALALARTSAEASLATAIRMWLARRSSGVV